MSYKIGFLLSTTFVILFFLLGVDLLNVQAAYGDLDSKSIAISYRISQYGTIDDRLVRQIEQTYHVDFECKGNCHPKFGDVVDYSISTTIQTMVVGNHELTISISRNAIIGFYS